MGIGELAAGVSIAICVALTWLSQWALNVDGVSYLDLTRAARSGNWDAFVQGYWSPLYPALLGVLSIATDGAPTSLLVLSHLFNGVAAVAAILLAWWWGRQESSPSFTPMLLAVLLLASTGLPRIEAVTPDVLLLALTCWIAYELLHHRGERMVPAGVALGLSFLAKTSVWPWLLVSIPLRLWGADGPRGRRSVVLSSGIALFIASLWIVPLSVASGGPTLGSAGKLNYSWYIEGSDARTPDTHLGRHQAARSIAVDSVRHVEVLTFEGADHWTYAPWSDPTAWSKGILSSYATFPTIPDLVAYWGRQAGRTFGFWILPVLLGVLVPAGIAFWDRGLPGRLFRERSPRTAASLLGLIGILQFVAVHAEPRLLAPFVLLLGAAAIEAIVAGTDPAPSAVTPGRVATAVAWGVVLWLSSIRISTGVKNGPRNAAAVQRILADQEIAALRTDHPHEILVAGPALAVSPAAFIAGVRIVAQLPPASLLVAQSLPTERQASLLQEVAGGRAGTIWITDDVGGVRILPIPENR
jgi:hypothetical protein